LATPIQRVLYATQKSLGTLLLLVWSQAGA
jgi:hypothetical protein